MKMRAFIPLICILSLALGEPPIGDGYPSARVSHDHDNEYNHSNDFQRSLSQEYEPPAARSFGTPRKAISTEYGPPNARSANSRSSLSQTYGPPNARSGISQEYGVPSARSSAQSSPASRGLSTEYRVPSARSSPSQTYGAPSARNGLSQEYGVPSVESNLSRTPSAQYGVPETRMPSEEYGVPSQRSFDGAPAEEYGAPGARHSLSSGNALSQEYGVPSARLGGIQHSHSTARSSVKSFGSSNSRSLKGSTQFGARSPSTKYGAPAVRSSSSYSQEIPPQKYGAPNQEDLSDTYGVPSARDLSQEYGVPAGRTANQKTSAIASSYSATRSDPSGTYGAPSARDSTPSEQYGVPEQHSNLSNDGYSYARDALDENQEPASYDFSYKVEDYESGSDFGHTETRQDNRAEGSYFVVLPDGTKQVVEYEADERGFKSRISVEPADFARSGGYDKNAAEINRSNDGPY